MAFKFSFVATIACFLGLTGASSAIAADVQDQRVVSPSVHRLAASTPLIAPSAVCPGQISLDAPAETQEQTMLCMADFARAQVGLDSLEEALPLVESASLKSRDILTCDDFSHFACGREFTHWIKQGGYLEVDCWRVGENIAWGRGEEGTVRAIFLAWMRSPTHRHNILNDFGQTGIDTRVGGMGPFGDVRVWTQHFGAVGCDTADA